MAEGDACLLDSNILLRISKSDDPQHPVIVRALKALVGQGVRLCYTSQTLGEFWNASTRPLDKNGFGLTVSETDRLARSLARLLRKGDLPEDVRALGVDPAAIGPQRLRG